MATKIKTAKPTKAVELNQEAIADIKKGVKAQASAYGFIQQAARRVAPELDLKISLQDAIKKASDAYSKFFDGNHNLQAVFRDQLILRSRPDHPVSIELANGEELHTTAGKIADTSKHNASKAAREVREELGLGRKRSARTPSKPVEGTKNPEKLSVGGMVQIVMARFTSDAEFANAIIAELKAQGYKVTKPRKS